MSPLLLILSDLFSCTFSSVYLACEHFREEERKEVSLMGSCEMRYIW